MEAKSLATFDTEYSADSIEFCPTPGYEHVFTCGTYQLLPVKSEERIASAGEDDAGREGEEGEEEEEDEETPPAERIGRLYLFNLDGDVPTEVQRVETAAILDAKWDTRSSAPGLFVADAKGGLTHYVLNDTLTEVQRLQVSDEETLVLSLDISSRGIMTSLSSGELAHVTRSTTGELQVETSWPAHDFEPWIVSWDQSHNVWSGGDDLKLKRWDVRIPSMPTFVNKNFEGGVTTIAPSPHDDHVLAVGSYDATLRIFDTRNPRLAVEEIELPGGIWRTRWHPTRKKILNACMHGGFAVVDMMEKAEIVKTFPGTLGYGADWCRREEEESLVATCSFYDHAMHLWRA